MLSESRHVSYDVIFMDVQMPYMDGIATSQAIKTSRNPTMPITSVYGLWQWRTGSCPVIGIEC